MQTRISRIRTTFWRFGIATGALTSVAVTLIVVVWEWLENPGGIFRNETGTNWGFVLDTATSWLIPTFIYAAVIASVAHLGWSAIKRRRPKE